MNVIKPTQLSAVVDSTVLAANQEPTSRVVTSTEMLRHAIMTLKHKEDVNGSTTARKVGYVNQSHPDQMLEAFRIASTQRFL
jgi:hypothetical protein